MDKREPRILREWQAYQYTVEKAYAARIVRSPKDSQERQRLFQEGYDRVMGEILGSYDAGDATPADRSGFIVRIVRRLVRRPGRVLDVGCGDGRLVGGLIRAGYEARGIDVSGRCIDRARASLSAMACEHCVERSDITSYRSAVTYDCIVMDNVLEHVVPDSVADVLARCHSMLSRNGSLLILTPHRYAGPHDVSRHFLPLGAMPEGLHLREYSFTQLESVLSEAGFRRILGFPLHPRLLGGLGIVPGPSRWAAAKARRLERLMEKPPLSRLLRLNRTLTYAMVAILFPAAVVGVKESGPKGTGNST